jgi:type VI secretion system lysozyme-like protein
MSMAPPGASFLSRLTQTRSHTAAGLVADNLGHVLNTRKGCGSMIPELGLGDYEAAPNTHEAVLVLERELRSLVLRYEPRLGDPEVKVRGRHGYSLVRFSLTGRMGEARHAFAIEIDTTTRQVDVWPEDGR